jgi:hypothetical protein
MTRLTDNRTPHSYDRAPAPEQKREKHVTERGRHNPNSTRSTEELT